MHSRDNGDEDSQRLEALRSRLDTVQGKGDKPTEKSSENSAITGYGVITELFAGILVGGGLGYYLDRWLETRPIFFLLLLLLGLAAAVLNIYKLSSEKDAGEK